MFISKVGATLKAYLFQSNFTVRTLLVKQSLLLSLVCARMLASPMAHSPSPSATTVLFTALYLPPRLLHISPLKLLVFLLPFTSAH